MTSPIIITFFNHKGGVGKTTSLREFAGVLSNEYKKKVLIVDADPQCSLTSATLYNFFLELGINLKREEDKDFDYAALSEDERTEINDDLVQKGEMFYRGDEVYENRRPQGSVRTLYEFLRPIVNESVDEETIRAQAAKTELVKVAGFDSLYVLPGELELSSLESVIGNGVKLHQVLPLYKKVPGAISRSIRVLAEQNSANIKFDVVLVDLNPGITSLNQSLLMGGDYYLLPALPDYYSRRAVYSFAKALHTWDTELVALRVNAPAQAPNPAAPSFLRNSQPARNDLSDFFKMPKMPQFLGYVCQRVKLRAAAGTGSKGKRVPVKVYDSEISKLRQYFNDYLLRVASVTNHFQLPVTPVVPESNSFGIATLRSGGTLSYSTSITGADSLNSGDVKRAADDFRQRFSYILRQLFRNMSTEDVAALNLPNDDKPLSLGSSKPSPTNPTPSQATNETPQKKRTRTVERIYQALIANEARQFNPIVNAGNGNCLFDSLGIDRNHFVDLLMVNYDRMNKQELVPEIHEAVQSKHFELPQHENQQYQTAMAAYERQTQSYNRFYTRIVRLFVAGGIHIPDELKNPEGERHNDLLRFLEANARELFVAQFPVIQEFADSHKAVSDVIQQITAILSSRIVVESYLTKLRTPFAWAGMKVADQYAHLSGDFNLRVWHADRSGELVQYETQVPFNEALPTIDILYSGGFHFEKLELQDELPARQHRRTKQAPAAGSSQGAASQPN